MKQNTKAALALALSPVLPLPVDKATFRTGSKKQPQRFLFQGDSITDGARGRNNDPNHIIGHGYAFSIASRVGAAFPEKELSFYNRGISGNTVQDHRQQRSESLEQPYPVWSL